MRYTLFFRYSLFPAPYSLLPIPCSLFPAPCSLLPAPYSLLPASCSLPEICTSQVVELLYANRRNIFNVLVDCSSLVRCTLIFATSQTEHSVLKHYIQIDCSVPRVTRPCELYPTSAI